MRIVHDIDYPSTVSGGCKGPYGKKKDTEKSCGFRCNLLVVTEGIFEGQEADVIHLAGDAACIREALVEAVAVIDVMAQGMLEAGGIDEDWKEKPARLRERIEAAKAKAEAARNDE